MALNISLYECWRIKSDPSNIILCHSENGRDITQGYYTNLEGAIQGFIQMKIKGFDSTSLQGLQESIKQLTARLHTLLQPFKIKVEAD